MAKIKINKVPKMRNTSVSYYNPHLLNPKPDFEDIEPVEEKITSTVGPVDMDVATIEAEKDELIVKPGLGGIWKIKGKKHSEGGTPLNPEPGSFIFSNDSDLAITKDERRLFSFEKGGSVAKTKNTPAKLLEREIDLKEYNRYQTILQNPKAEKIERATAQLMVEKYQKIMGQVAYLQESKKTAPVPQFAMGTAPMKNPTIEAQEEQQQMYKRGGLIKMALGDEFCPCGKDITTGECLPCPDNTYREILKSRAKKVDTPTAGYDPLYTDPSGSRLYGKFGQMKTPPGKGSKQFNDAFAAAKKQGLKSFTFNGKLYNTNIYKPTAKDTEDYVYTDPKKVIDTPPERPNRPPGTIVDKRPPFIETPPAGIKPPEGPKEEPTVGNLPYDIKGYLTPAQKANLSYLGLQAMSVKRYMPMREQINLGRVSLDKQNLQPFLNGIRNQEFQSYNSAKVINPRQASLLNSNTFGRGVDAETQARGQVEAANIQTGNQENLTNLQQSNQEQMFNIPASGKYYDQTVASKQNFDDEKRFANNQVMSTLNKYQSDADALAWSLASVNKYGTRKVTDPKTGKVYNQPVPLYEYLPNGGIRYNADVASLNMATGADKTNSFDEYSKNIQSLIDMGLDARSAAFIVGNMMKSKNPIYQKNPTFPNQ
jgi:hypothetical protein